MIALILMIPRNTINYYVRVYLFKSTVIIPKTPAYYICYLGNSVECVMLYFFDVARAPADPRPVVLVC